MNKFNSDSLDKSLNQFGSGSEEDPHVDARDSLSVKSSKTLKTGTSQDSENSLFEE